MLYGNNINGEIPATPAAEMTCGLYGNKPWIVLNILRILADFLESTSYSSTFLAKDLHNNRDGVVCRGNICDTYQTRNSEMRYALISL